MSVDYKSLKNGLHIDKNSLDEELIQHAELYYNVASEAIHACDHRDQMKLELEQVKAEANLKLREDYNKKKLKFTEGLILAEALTDPLVQEVSQDYLDAKEKADQFNALRDAFSQRSYMLRELVQLYVSQYYAADSVVTENSTAKEVIQKEVRKKQVAKRTALRRPSVKNG